MSLRGILRVPSPSSFAANRSLARDPAASRAMLSPMSKLVVFGQGPMPWERSDRAYPHALRTWRVARALARAGHDVRLLALRPDGDGAPRMERSEHGGVSVWSLSEHTCHERPDRITSQVASLRPDGVIGVHREPSAIAANFVGDLPFWVDLDEDPMVGAQARAAHGIGDWLVNEAYRKHVPVLLRGDRFSTRSQPQRLALIGQLGAVGRLLAKNDGYDFVSVVPNGIDSDELEALQRIDRRLRRPSDPFVLLWSGGFHPWAHLDLLFEVLEMVMAESDRVRFLCTGSAVDETGMEPYARFARRAAESPFRDRFELLGWVERDDLMACYARADAAIFVERFGYQSLLGARSRVTEWLAAGLPIVCTDLTEASRALREQGIVSAVPSGDAMALRAAIRALADEPEDALARGLRGRRYVRERCVSAVSMEPLLAWAAGPHRAPAREARAPLEWPPGLASGLRQHAITLRTHLATGGPGSAVAAVGRFAVRRLVNGAARAAERLGAPPSASEE